MNPPGEADTNEDGPNANRGTGPDNSSHLFEQQAYARDARRPEERAQAFRRREKKSTQRDPCQSRVCASSCNVRTAMVLRARITAPATSDPLSSRLPRAAAKPGGAWAMRARVITVGVALCVACKGSEREVPKPPAKLAGVRDMDLMPVSLSGVSRQDAAPFMALYDFYPVVLSSSS